MTRTEIARLLCIAARAAQLAAIEPDEALAGQYVDAGAEALLDAQAASEGTELAAAVCREAKVIGERLARVAERRLAA